MSRTQVLIAGAGPTGLVLALWLTKYGVAVRIIDKAPEAGTTSRALAVHARTLELYEQLGLTDAVLSKGHKTPGVNLWVRGERAARIGFEVVGEALTPFPFLHIYPQDEHEKLLEDTLAEAGVKVERRTELTGFTDDGVQVVAQLKGPDGEETVEADFIAGCDGARSAVRGGIGGTFPGGTYRQLFYVADVEAEGPPADGELHVDLDEADFLALFPLAGQGRARLIGTVRDERADHPENLTFADVSGRAIEHMQLKVGKVNWFSTYHVHHRVTDHFRKGRAFVLGDAAHIHSPAGGQGMNTGIGDAINLAWKLAAVLAGKAPQSLLDSYEVERIAFARRLVASTDRGFTLASAEGPAADFIRTRLFPLVAKPLMSLEAVREFAFRTVSQITLNYRQSSLSEGKVGKVHGGDRLPWAEGDAIPSEMDWQVQICGDAPEAVVRWCEGRHLRLTQIPWSDAHEAAGFHKGALYLLRPDTYIAVVQPAPDTAALDSYFSDHGLTVGG